MLLNHWRHSIVWIGRAEISQAKDDERRGNDVSQIIDSNKLIFITKANSTDTDHMPATHRQRAQPSADWTLSNSRGNKKKRCQSATAASGYLKFRSERLIEEDVIRLDDERVCKEQQDPPATSLIDEIEMNLSSMKQISSDTPPLTRQLDNLSALSASSSLLSQLLNSSLNQFIEIDNGSSCGGGGAAAAASSEPEPDERDLRLVTAKACSAKQMSHHLRAANRRSDSRATSRSSSSYSIQRRKLQSGRNQEPRVAIKGADGDHADETGGRPSNSLSAIRIKHAARDVNCRVTASDEAANDDLLERRQIQVSTCLPVKKSNFLAEPRGQRAAPQPAQQPFVTMIRRQSLRKYDNVAHLMEMISKLDSEADEEEEEEEKVAERDKRRACYAIDGRESPKKANIKPAMECCKICHDASMVSARQEQQAISDYGLQHDSLLTELHKSSGRDNSAIRCPFCPSVADNDDEFVNNNDANPSRAKVEDEASRNAKYLPAFQNHRTDNMGEPQFPVAAAAAESQQRTSRSAQQSMISSSAASFASFATSASSTTSSSSSSSSCGIRVTTTDCSSEDSASDKQKLQQQQLVQQPPPAQQTYRQPRPYFMNESCSLETTREFSEKSFSDDTSQFNSSINRDQSSLCDRFQSALKISSECHLLKPAPQEETAAEPINQDELDWLLNGAYADLKTQFTSKSSPELTPPTTNTIVLPLTRIAEEVSCEEPEVEHSATSQQPAPVESIFTLDPRQLSFARNANNNLTTIELNDDEDRLSMIEATANLARVISCDTSRASSMMSLSNKLMFARPQDEPMPLPRSLARMLDGEVNEEPIYDIPSLSVNNSPIHKLQQPLRCLSPDQKYPSKVARPKTNESSHATSQQVLSTRHRRRAAGHHHHHHQTDCKRVLLNDELGRGRHQKATDGQFVRLPVRSQLRYLDRGVDLSLLALNGSDSRAGNNDRRHGRRSAASHRDQRSSRHRTHDRLRSASAMNRPAIDREETIQSRASNCCCCSTSSGSGSGSSSASCSACCSSCSCCQSSETSFCSTSAYLNTTVDDKSRLARRRRRRRSKATIAKTRRQRSGSRGRQTDGTTGRRTMRCGGHHRNRNHHLKTTPKRNLPSASSSACSLCRPKVVSTCRHRCCRRSRRQTASGRRHGRRGKSRHHANRSKSCSRHNCHRLTRRNSIKTGRQIIMSKSKLGARRRRNAPSSLSLMSSYLKQKRRLSRKLRKRMQQQELDRARFRRQLLIAAQQNDNFRANSARHLSPVKFAKFNKKSSKRAEQSPIVVDQQQEGLLREMMFQGQRMKEFPVPPMIIKKPRNNNKRYRHSSSTSTGTFTGKRRRKSLATMNQLRAMQKALVASQQQQLSMRGDYVGSLSPRYRSKSPIKANQLKSDSLMSRFLVKKLVTIRRPDPSIPIQGNSVNWQSAKRCQCSHCCLVEKFIQMDYEAKRSKKLIKKQQRQQIELN